MSQKDQVRELIIQALKKAAQIRDLKGGVIGWTRARIYAALVMRERFTIKWEYQNSQNPNKSQKDQVREYLIQALKKAAQIPDLNGGVIGWMRARMYCKQVMRERLTQHG